MGFEKNVGEDTRGVSKNVHGKFGRDRLGSFGSYSEPTFYRPTEYFAEKMTKSKRCSKKIRAAAKLYVLRKRCSASFRAAALILIKYSAKYSVG